MTSIKKICLLSGLLFFLGSGCTTPSNINRYNFAPTNAAPIKYYPIDKEQVVTFSNSIRPIQGELKAKYDLARHFQQLQKHRIAIEALKEVIQMDPTHAYAHNAMGYSYDCLGDYPTAQQHYRTAIVLNPELDLAYNNLGYSLFWMENMWRRLKR